MGFNPAHFNLLLILILLPLYFFYVLIIACFSKRNPTRNFTIGLFHPYCNAGGGGERVLWAALRSLQQKYPDYEYYIYTGDVNVSHEQMIKNAKSRFNIEIQPGNLRLVHLKWRNWVEAEKYPSFTLIGQSLGSMILGLEATVALHPPDVIIDTMGYAFTLPIFKYIGGANVGCYVHYPTISTDMLNKVSSGEESYNNQNFVAKSPVLSAMKLFYYKAFARLYSWMGSASEAIMVNSSWTESHINQLWQVPTLTFKVYPPCNTDAFKKIPQPENDLNKSGFRIVSVAQFRPEKDHPLQLRAMVELRKLVTEEVWNKVKLVLIGSVRNEDDERRVNDLRKLSEELDLTENIEFHLNVSFQELQQQLADGLIGIHTMWNEHFGIGIVECMAAGLIMVAHKSGGPLMDIVLQDEKQRNGFLAADEKEYGQTIAKILKLKSSQRQEIRLRARESVTRFSDEEFSTRFLSVVEPLLKVQVATAR